ncbi:hypothetical protein Pelo_19259 [Pelomyxa schiedti]|nr:hypothetical protein Pelo_19259 [Pelomyxa schiedti]
MRLLSHRWVTSPARLCALTFTTANTSEGDCNGDGEDEGDWVWPSKQRQLWVRVSHTLGVVDSGWFDTDASLGILSHRCCGSIGSSHIVTQSGESMQVSGLGGERCVEYVGEDPEMSVCCNDRWMVVYGSKLVIWKVNESGLGALVTRNPTLVIDEDNGIEVTLARFSYQRGTDVLMLFCYKHKNDDEKGSPFILCVDLRATLASRSLAVLSERSVNCSTEYHYASDFLEVGGVLYVVLQPLSVQGRMLFCVESGALYRFPQGHAVYTVGGSHFCAFSRNFWDYSQKIPAANHLASVEHGTREQCQPSRNRK